MAQDAQQIIDDFHRLYYTQGPHTWQKTYWRGVLTLKCPLDLWVYQELLGRRHPDLVIETGTAMGGSALFLADLFDLIGAGRVITIDIDGDLPRPEHPRIRYLQGSSTDPTVLAQVRAEVRPGERCFVILDSDHRRSHVLNELRAYQGFVGQGDYLIVEDTNVNGHPVSPEFGPGPAEAIETFLRESDRFAVDRECEKFFMTFNPGGFLRCVGGVAERDWG